MDITANATAAMPGEDRIILDCSEQITIERIIEEAHEPTMGDPNWENFISVAHIAKKGGVAIAGVGCYIIEDSPMEIGIWDGPAYGNFSYELMTPETARALGLCLLACAADVSLGCEGIKAIAKTKMQERAVKAEVDCNNITVEPSALTPSMAHQNGNGTTDVYGYELALIMARRSENPYDEFLIAMHELEVALNGIPRDDQDALADAQVMAGQLKVITDRLRRRGKITALAQS